MSENRINVIDIIEKIKNGNDNAFDGIQIKDYLSIATKRLICEEIAKNSIIEQNGMKIKDSIAYEIAFDLVIVSFYTNVDIDENYDEACEYKIIDFIKENMNQSERDFISEHSYYMVRNEIDTYNSLAGVINRNLQKLIEKLPDEKSLSKLAKTTVKELNKINPDKFKYVNDVVSALEGKSNVNG
jgi:hypothetical protein